MSVQKIKVLLVDDHMVVRMGLTAVLRFEKDIAVVGEAEDGRQGVEAFQQLKPDVVVIDLRMPVMDGIEAIAAITQQTPDARILILTSFEDPLDIRRAFTLGAKGCILKNSSRGDLATAIRTVAKGGRYVSPEVEQQLRIAEELPVLTDRQREVLQLLARGLTNRDIGVCLDISLDGVKAHLGVIYTKLGVADRAEAVAVGLKLRLIRNWGDA